MFLILAKTTIELIKNVLSIKVGLNKKKEAVLKVWIASFEIFFFKSFTPFWVVIRIKVLVF